MTQRWGGPALDTDQRDVIAMIDALAGDQPVDLVDNPEHVTSLVTSLAGLGVWTLGTAVACGGGGAPASLATVVFERLGRFWPALGWAAVQTHAAVDLLGADPASAGLVGQLHSGVAAIAVVPAGAPATRLVWSDGALVGTIARVDAASESPHLVLLASSDTVLLVAPEALVAQPLVRTGLGGAFTRSLTVHARGHQVRAVAGVDVPAARARLHLGAAAVAAGIAGAAAGAAVGYAAGRRQFGDVLTALPIVRQSLLNQAGTAGSALATVLAADPADPVQTAAALRFACDGAVDVAAAALQSHGGYGYLTEYRAERYLRDAISLRAAADVPAAAVGAARDRVGREPMVSLGAEPS